MKIFILVIFALCSVAASETTEAPTKSTPTIVTTDAPTKAPTTTEKTTMEPTTKTTSTMKPTTTTVEPTTKTTETTKVTTTKSSTNGTTKATTTITTAKPTTTPKPTNATTPKPTNATTTPATTIPPTTSKNTTTVPSNTTTVPSNTTTVPANTTTPTPPTTPLTTSTTPSPIVNFNYKKDNKTCIKLTGNIRVHYKYMEGNQTKNGSIHFDMKAKVTGKCSDLMTNTSNSYITLTEKPYVLTLSFATEGKEWYLKKVDVQVGSVIQGNAKYNLTSNSGLYQAPLNKSYACATKKTLNMDVTTPKKKNATLTVDLQSMMMQPSGEDYNNTISCPASNSDTSSGSSIVPIAVGCALAGLIVIVLIAYLIGRRKNSNRGYQQV